MSYRLVYLCVLQIFCIRISCMPNGTKDSLQLEPCPADSVMSEGVCKCFHEFCEKPTCNYTLTQVSEGSNSPGQCCPMYSCIGCDDDSKIDGKCPCAKEAVINDVSGKCDCVDPFKTIADGKCECDLNKCQLPQLCDPQSVAVKEGDGSCCETTKCIPCPEDSHPTNYDDQSVEDKCVCSPCPDKMCGDNQIPIVHRRGNNFPGTCCDLYFCESMQPNKSCTSDGVTYKENDTWSPKEGEVCRCQNGISFCSSAERVQTESPQTERSCLSDDNLYYSHLTSWMEDDNCTNCTCFNGEIKCISHFCDVVEDKVEMPSSTEGQHRSCSMSSGVIFAHQISWLENDGCTNCTCLDNEVKCVPLICNATKDDVTGSTTIDCPPLASCKKKCENGFKSNKKGCSVCKCKEDYPNVRSLLKACNISDEEALKLFQEYFGKDSPDYSYNCIPLAVVVAAASMLSTLLLVGTLYFVYIRCRRKKFTHEYSPVNDFKMDNNNKLQKNFETSRGDIIPY